MGSGSPLQQAVPWSNGYDCGFWFRQRGFDSLWNLFLLFCLKFSFPFLKMNKTGDAFIVAAYPQNAPLLKGALMNVAEFAPRFSTQWNTQDFDFVNPPSWLIFWGVWLGQCLPYTSYCIQNPQLSCAGFVLSNETSMRDRPSFANSFV